MHYLTGPIAVATAEPGDLLKVELLNLGPLEVSPYHRIRIQLRVTLPHIASHTSPRAPSLLALRGLQGDEWGFTGTFHKDNGGGFLCDHYPQATKVSNPLPLPPPPRP